MYGFVCNTTHPIAQLERNHQIVLRMHNHHRLAELPDVLIRLESQVIRVHRPRDHIVEPRQIAEQSRHRMVANLRVHVVERRLEDDRSGCRNIVPIEMGHHVRRDARAEGMAPQVDGVLRATSHVIVGGDRITDDARLGRLNGRRVTEATVVDGDHVVAEAAQHFVQLDAMVGEAGIGVAVQIEDNLGAGLLERALEELGLVGGVDRAEPVEIELFHGRRVVGWNGSFGELINRFLYIFDVNKCYFKTISYS